MTSELDKNNGKWFDTRTILAGFIVVAAILGISAISITIIVVTDSEDNKVSERAQVVFNATLPLLGTWVGTVLAYYFARENFETASRSAERLVQLSPQEKLQSTLVAVAMTAKSKMFSADKNEAKLVEILKEANDRGFRRIPILTTSAFPKFLIYRDDILYYLFDKSQQDRDGLTLQNFLDDSTANKRPFAIVGEDSTLAAAKEAMDKIPDCHEVFVTKNGRSDSEVVGLLTNTDIEKYSKV
ncbi:CBS domain-containing protein [Synechococcus sp. PCC 6312]|uniref:CBS domain-containing protein n=1 Tax=Synechococcus sp. (strain ATCC 27167 / PCC 6312) TaxID=195253 RepID=UPI00029F1527|nr:CBS domain-containing protein [Synechococcus sp. PCC 6312]AFY61799.1 hypothetical protein Syn6312_2713 [Synechococcus sp. PCC 6312]